MSQRIRIKQVTVIDGLGNPPLPDCTVIIENQRIQGLWQGNQALSADKSADKPTELVIDGKNKYLLPGLMDMQIFPHAYALAEPTHINLWHRSNANEMKMLHAVKNLSFLLDSGYTTIRAFGMPGSLDIHLREAVSLGLIRGPRLFCSGQHLSPTGGHAEEMYGSPFGLREPGQTVDGVTECLKAVRTRLREGADFIMIHCGGGIMGKDKMYWRNFTPAEMQAIVQEAHAFDMLASAHVGSGLSVKTALDAGVDIIEQGYCLDDQHIAQMKEQGTRYVPTLAVTYACVAHAEKTGISRQALYKGQRAWETHQASVRKAYKAGVKLASGSNCFNLIRVESARTEFPLLAGVGIPALEIIRLATSAAAEALRFGSQCGSITPGKLADLILLTADPLQNIAVLGDPALTSLVIKEGKIVKQSKGSP